MIGRIRSVEAIPLREPEWRAPRDWWCTSPMDAFLPDHDRLAVPPPDRVTNVLVRVRTEEGVEKVTHVPEGSCLFQPPLVPHSPRFASDSFQLVIERSRVPGEIDRFVWFCQNCDEFLHEETYAVDDYRADPVTQAYRNFYDSEAHRTCKKCGTIMPAPSSL